MPHRSPGPLAICVLAALGCLISPVRLSAQTRFEVVRAFTYSSGVAPFDPYSELFDGADGYLYGTTAEGGTANLGTVFSIDASGQVVVLHSFSGADGAVPTAPVIRGPDGALYGVTLAGGSGNGGTAFRLETNGSFATIHLFIDPSHGRAPVGALLLAQNGDFYGTTRSDGEFGRGSVFRMTSAGNVSLVHSFTDTEGTPTCCYGTLIQATDGKLYGTTYGTAGPSPSFGVAYTVDDVDTFSVIHTFGIAEDIQQPSRLVQADDGNFYGTGASNYIFRMTVAGAVSILHTLDPPTEGQNPNAGLIQGADGGLYGTTPEAGSLPSSTGNGTVFRIGLDGHFTVLHTFNQATDGGFSVARVIQGADGALYGTARFGGTGLGGTIFKVRLDVPTVTVAASTFGFDGNPHEAVAVATGVDDSPIAGSFSYIYSPGGIPPASPGTYDVLATFTSGDPRYVGASGSGTITILEPNTPVGFVVSVQPVDPNSNTAPVTITFASVSRQGTTGVAISEAGQPPPSGFTAGTPPRYYDITTTAEFSGAITVCVNYSGITFTGNPSLFHLEGGTWVDRTVQEDPGQQIVCASVTSLSPFALFQRAGTVVSALGPAAVWIGLKNSDDVGTRLDLLVEVLKGTAVIGSGQLNGVVGGSSGFNNAVLRTVTLAMAAPVLFAPSEVLAVRISARISTTVAGHSSGTARLWFNDAAANSRLGLTLAGAPSTGFLAGVPPSALSVNLGAAGTGPKRSIDVSLNKNVGGNPFKPFGTWTLVVP